MNNIIEQLKKHKGNCSDIERSIYQAISHGNKKDIIVALNWSYQNKTLFSGYLNQFVKEFDKITEMLEELDEAIATLVDGKIEEAQECGNCNDPILEDNGSYSYSDGDLEHAEQEVLSDIRSNITQFNNDFEIVESIDDSNFHYDNEIRHLEKLLTYLY